MLNVLDRLVDVTDVDAAADERTSGDRGEGKGTYTGEGEGT